MNQRTPNQVPVEFLGSHRTRQRQLELLPLLLLTLTALLGAGCGRCPFNDQDEDGHNGTASWENCEPPDGPLDDCDDFDPLVYPGADETCDGKDNDCDGVIDIDDDQDEHISPLCDGGDDCDDTSPDVYAGAEELCNGEDDNCDGKLPAGEVSADGDGVTGCGGDCDDSNSDVYSGAVEVPYNGLDDDCVGGDVDDQDGDGERGFMAGGPDCDDLDASATSASQLELVIAAGVFLMGADGDDDYSPAHEVYLSSYCLDRTEVSVAAYQSCADAGACEAPEQLGSATRANYYDDPTYTDYPMVNVSWAMALAFCEWRGKTLPTEAQWEKGARGGYYLDGDIEAHVPNAYPERLYPWGVDEATCERANFKYKPEEGESYSCTVSDGASGDTDAVSTRPSGYSPNSILNLSGNVAEWVSDWYSDDYYQSGVYADPTGPNSGDQKVIRGGYYSSGLSSIRLTQRTYDPPESATSFVGFRCSRPGPPSEPPPEEEEE